MKINWPDHYNNGGTGLTRNAFNYSDEYKQISESVRLFNDPEIFMSDDGNELHTTRIPADASDFWEFHRQRTK